MQAVIMIAHQAALWGVQFELKVVAGGSAFGAACVAAATHSYMRSVGNDFRSPIPPRKFPARRLSATNLHNLAGH
jgi:uncharacterized protein (DUF2237 family)